MSSQPSATPSAADAANAAPTAAADATPTPAAATSTLTVMSFNIRHAVGTDRRLDLERIARIIRESGAQVVGLQEVDRHLSERSAMADQPGQLASMLGMEVLYSPGVRRPRADGTEGQYGTALLSSLPMADHSLIDLPVQPSGEQRTLAQATVQVNGTAVRVMNTHLTPGVPQVRMTQAERILAEVREHPQRPAILLGDFNTTPGTPSYVKLRSMFTDAWLDAERRHTRLDPAGKGATFPAILPLKRIDFALVRHLRTLKARVPFSLASDHRPLLVTVALDG